MGQLQDTMYRDTPMVIRDVTAAQFAAQGTNTDQSIIYRVDGVLHMPQPTGGYRAMPMLDTTLAKSLSSRMTVLPTRSRMAALTTLTGALLDAGLIDALDCLYVLAQHDSQAARLNIIGNGGQNLTAVNSPVFTTDRGYAGDGSTSYLDTSLAGNSGYNYTKDSAFVAIWSLTELANNTANDVSGGGKSYINARTAGGTLAMRCNNSTASASSVTVSSSLGMSAISRLSADGFSAYKNGSLLGDFAVASEAPGSTTFQIGRNSTNYSSRQIAVMAAGRGLTQSEYQAFYAAVSTYLTAIGAV